MSDRGWTKVHSAALKGDIPAIRKAIDEKANLMGRDTLGGTPLHIAAQHSQHEAIRVLVEAKVPVDVEQDDGQTPLQLAIKETDLETVKVLVGLNADIRHQDKMGTPPIFMALDVDTRDKPEHVPGSILDYLFDLNVDVNEENKITKETLIHRAIVRENEEFDNWCMTKYIADVKNADLLHEDILEMDAMDFVIDIQHKKMAEHLMHKFKGLENWEWPDPKKKKKKPVVKGEATDEEKAAAIEKEKKEAGRTDAGGSPSPSGTTTVA
eukprot:RCo009032